MPGEPSASSATLPALCDLISDTLETRRRAYTYPNEQHKGYGSILVLSLRCEDVLDPGWLMDNKDSQGATGQRQMREKESKPYMGTPVWGRGWTAAKLTAAPPDSSTPCLHSAEFSSPGALQRGAGLPLKVTVPVCTYPPFKGGE